MSYLYFFYIYIFYFLPFILVFKFYSSCTVDVREMKFHSSVSLVHTAELTIKLTLTLTCVVAPKEECTSINMHVRANVFARESNQTKPQAGPATTLYVKQE